MDFLTDFIYQFFKPRNKRIDRYTMEAGDIQEQQLRRLLEQAKNTSWGKKYDYKHVAGYDDYKNRFPVQCYDQLKGDIGLQRVVEQPVIKVNFYLLLLRF